MTSTALYSQVKDTLDRIGPGDLGFNEADEEWYLIVPGDWVDDPDGTFRMNNTPRITAQQAQAIIEHYLMSWLDEHTRNGYTLQRRNDKQCNIAIANYKEDKIYNYQHIVTDNRLSALIWAVEQVLEAKDE